MGLWSLGFERRARHLLNEFSRFCAAEACVVVVEVTDVVGKVWGLHRH